MKIMIYILFFCAFLVFLIIMFAVLIRSFAFLISSIKYFVNKFSSKVEHKNDVIVGEQGTGKKINFPVEMESIEIKEGVENDIETISE